MQKPRTGSGLCGVSSAPERIRTSDLRLRRPTLYPTELRAPAGWEANKPSSVSRDREVDHLSGTAVTRRLERPTRDSHGLAAVSARATPSSLLGLAPGGVYRAAPVTRDAVGSYPTVSPLPVPLRAIGGLFSVALSVASRRPGVTRHPALWSSDFPRPQLRRPRSTLASDPVKQHPPSTRHRARSCPGPSPAACERASLVPRKYKIACLRPGVNPSHRQKGGPCAPLSLVRTRLRAVRPPQHRPCPGPP